MRFEHLGLTKMLAVLVPFALALSFVGCSGESSTAADGNFDDPENSAIDDDSSGKDSSSSSSSSSKKNDSSGKDDSSSSSKKDGSSSSKKERFDNVNVPDVEIGKCDFKQDDYGPMLTLKLKMTILMRCTVSVSLMASISRIQRILSSVGPRLPKSVNRRRVKKRVKMFS